jgi:hypothetical protein
MIFTPVRLICLSSRFRLASSTFEYEYNIYTIVTNDYHGDIRYPGNRCVVLMHYNEQRRACKSDRWCNWDYYRAIETLPASVITACELWAETNYEMGISRFLNATLGDIPTI